MKVKNIHAHHFNDYRRKSADDLDQGVQRLLTDDDFKKNYYALTCLEYSPLHGKIFCGSTNFSLDLLQTFDPQTKRFESMRYQDFSNDNYEVKIHRSLAVDKDGSVIGATSCLYPESERLKAPGGRIFRFDYAKRTFETITIPQQHDYIQTISVDFERGLVYGFTYPVFCFFVYSMKEDRVIYSQYTGSIPHLSVIDDNGGYWGTWSMTKHHFFRYDPDRNEIDFFEHGFPTPCKNLMYPGSGPIDNALNIGDGAVYFTSETAELYRLDPKDAKLTYLGKAFPSVRLPALTMGPDGALYGAGGADWDVRLTRYDLKRGVFTDLGMLKDTTTGEPCFRAHDCVFVGNSLYVGETDHSMRSNHLWEVELF